MHIDQQFTFQNRTIKTYTRKSCTNTLGKQSRGSTNCCLCICWSFSASRFTGWTYQANGWLHLLYIPPSPNYCSCNWGFNKNTEKIQQQWCLRVKKNLFNSLLQWRPFHLVPRIHKIGTILVYSTRVIRPFKIWTTSYFHNLGQTKFYELDFTSFGLLIPEQTIDWLEASTGVNTPRWKGAAIAEHASR